MRGDILYQIYGVHGGRAKDSYFGSFRTVEEANAEIAVLRAKEMDGENWAKRYHDRGFVVREATVDTDFELPSRPTPRDRYCVKTSTKQNAPGRWNSTLVEVLERGADPGEFRRVCEYERNYAMYQTFEPFRQGGRDYALISRDYTATAVLDLATGAVIAEEPHDSHGFCPVGFYVPDWWDVNQHPSLPGSLYWTPDDEWPVGAFGFVWGCIWGDDSSWKVQYLDLGRIRDGVIGREERFGYVELDTSGYRSPCLTLDAPNPAGSAPPFVSVSIDKGNVRVGLSVAMNFDLASGKPTEWQRLRIANFE